MSLLSVDEVKKFAQISGSAYDTTIELLIPVVTEHIESYCNTKFMSGSLSALLNTNYSLDNYDNYDTVEQVYPQGLKLAASLMIKYQLNAPLGDKTSETIGSYSVTYNLNYPQSIYNLLNPYVVFGFV